MLVSILSISLVLQTFFIVVSLDLFSFFILLYICVFFVLQEHNLVWMLSLIQKLKLLLLI